MFEVRFLPHPFLSRSYFQPLEKGSKWDLKKKLYSSSGNVTPHLALSLPALSHLFFPNAQSEICTVFFWFSWPNLFSHLFFSCLTSSSHLFSSVRHAMSQLLSFGLNSISFGLFFSCKILSVRFPRTFHPFGFPLAKYKTQWFSLYQTISSSSLLFSRLTTSLPIFSFPGSVVALCMKKCFIKLWSFKKDLKIHIKSSGFFKLSIN